MKAARIIALSLVCCSVRADVCDVPVWSPGRECWRVIEMCHLLELYPCIGTAPDSVWRPGRDCWHVREHCEALERYTHWHRYQNGPGGRTVVSLVSGRSIRSVEVTPAALKWGEVMDRDSDGDIDLRDWQFVSNELK